MTKRIFFIKSFYPFLFRKKRVTFSLSEISDEVKSTPRSEETSTPKPSTATPSYFSFLMNATTQSTPVFSRPKLDKSKD